MLFYTALFFFLTVCNVKLMNAEEYMVFGSTSLSMSLSRLSKQENEDLQAKCGIHKFNQPVNRIAGGTFAYSGQFPWAVSLVLAKKNFCGGSLISDRHVLTALHCVFSFDKPQAGDCRGPKFKFSMGMPQSVEVRYGGVCIRVEERDECMQEDTKTAYIKKMFFSNEFVESGCSTGSDFIIIELDQRVQFSYKTQPICLRNIPNKVAYLRQNFSQFYDLGWGKDAENMSSARLKFLATDITNILKGELYAKTKPHDDGRRTSICIGDSGGPLIGLDNTYKRAVLLGLHSSGDVCTKKINNGHRNVFVPEILDIICKWTGVCAE